MSADAKPVQRNFMLPAEQAEWLRHHAFHSHRKQAEIVREALAEYRERHDHEAPSDAAARNRELVERFSTGQGLDLDLLANKNHAMWGLDE